MTGAEVLEILEFYDGLYYAPAESPATDLELTINSLLHKGFDKVVRVRVNRRGKIIYVAVSGSDWLDADEWPRETRQLVRSVERFYGEKIKKYGYYLAVIPGASA